MFSPTVLFDDTLSVKNVYTAFVAHRKKDFDFKGESHNFWELVYINSGTVGITSGGKALECKMGTAVLHKPGEFHSIWSVGGTEPVYTVLTFDIKGQKQDRLKGLAVNLSSEGIEIMSKISRLISSIAFRGSIYPKKLQEEPILSIKLQKLLELALVLCIEENDGAEFKMNSPDAEIFAAAVEIMKKNIEAPLSSDEIAKELHVSLSKLKRIFKKYAMTGVHEYYFIIRLNMAAKMLLNGKTAKECAEKCGFQNQNYFSAAFKRHFGVSPSKYK